MSSGGSGVRRGWIFAISKAPTYPLVFCGQGFPCYIILTAQTFRAATLRKGLNTMATINTAKSKAPSLAERQRNIKVKNMAASSKVAVAKTLEEAREAAIAGAKAGESASRVYALKLEEVYGKDWFTWSAANARSDNEKALFAAIEQERKACQARAMERGLTNRDKAWSDAKAVSRGRFYGDNPRQANLKSLDATQLEVLTKLYKKAMKEERPTDMECDVNAKIGELLVAYFKVDLTKLG